MDSTQYQIDRTTAYACLPQWMTVEETAAYSGKSAWTIYQHVHQGLIPYRRVGRTILIPREFFNPDHATKQVTA